MVLLTACPLSAFLCFEVACRRRKLAVVHVARAHQQGPAQAVGTTLHAFHGDSDAVLGPGLLDTGRHVRLIRLYECIQ
jgi:hypothetical protein